MVRTAKIWTWLSSESEGFVRLVGTLIASLPGAPEELEDMGYDPLPMGWTELELITELLSSIRNEDDVAEAAELFMHGYYGEDDDDENKSYDVTVKTNVEQGFYDRQGRFHPIRASLDYDPEEAGEPEHWSRTTSPKKRRGPSPLIAKRRRTRKKK